MATLNTEIEISPIFQASKEGLINVLQTAVSKNRIPVMLVAGENDMRQVMVSEGNVSYPYISLEIMSINQGQNVYNREALRRMGKRSGLEKSGQYYFKYHLSPVEVSFRLRYHCQTYDEMLTFAQIWSFQERRLTFNLEDNLFRVGIQVRTMPELAIPTLEQEPIGERYIVETEILMDTYVGTVQKIPTIVLVKGFATVVSQEEAANLELAGYSLEPYIRQPLFTLTRDPLNDTLPN